MPIYTLEELADVTHSAKENGKIVGLCHGCFDILHIGHVRHFHAAKTMCDLLFVSVTADRFVNKGPDRPVIPGRERVEIISSLSAVSGAIINEAATSTELLTCVQPSIYFKGQEYSHGRPAATKNFMAEKALAKDLGIEVKHTFEKVCSSSKIINSLKKP